MKVLLLIFAGIALGWCDKLDRTYLPPPGSKFSGGSAGDIQTPLEFPKEPPFPGSFGTFGQRLRNQVPTSNGFGTNQQNLQGFGQPGLGQDLIPQSPFVPSQQPPQNNFEGNLNLPTTTTSYAFTQTTTYPPDFESVTGSPGLLFDSQQVAQQFQNVNIPGQASYPPGSGISAQGSAYDQQGPSDAQGRPTYGPKPQDVQVTDQQGYQAPNSEFVNPSFINNQDQNNQEFLPSTTPSAFQYGTRKNDQSQQYLNPNIPSGSLATIPGSQSGIANQARPSLKTSQSPVFNQYQGPFNNVQPSVLPNFPTSQIPLQNQNVGPRNNLQTSAAPGYVTPQRPNQINQYQPYRANQPVFKDNQNRFSPTEAPGSNSNVALNGPAYPQFGSENANKNVANYGDSQRYNPNIPSSAFDQPPSTPSPINFASSTASTFSPEINSPSTPTYSNSQIQQQYVPSSRPERIQAVADRNAYILNYENVRTPDSFSYSFDTSNGIHADESGTATDGVKATGSYSYTGDDGKRYSVVYTADENGFMPHGDHLPTPPPVPEAILRVIGQANRDKEAGVIPDDGSYDVDKYGDKKYQGATGIKQKYKPLMEGMLSKNRTGTPQQENNFPISRKGEDHISTTQPDKTEDYDDQKISEKAKQDRTAAEDYDIENLENIDTVSPPEKPASDERKSNYNRKQEMSMRKSSKKPLRPKFDTTDDLEEHDNLETSDRKPSRNQSTKTSQRKQNQRPGNKFHRRPSSKNSNVRNQVPVSSTTARYEDEDEDSKFNGNRYLPHGSSKNGYEDEEYDTNDDTDSYEQAEPENPDKEDDYEDHQGPFLQTKNVKYPVDEIKRKMKPSSQNYSDNKNQRSRIRPQNPGSIRRRPSNEDISDNDRTLDSKYQKKSMTPSTSANNNVRNEFNQRNQPSRKQPAFSTQKPIDNNQEQESGYEYNPPQKPFTQMSPSISIPQKDGAQSSSAVKVPASISNEYEPYTPISHQRFQTPSGSPPNRYENQRVTSRPITTAYPDFENETPENELYKDENESNFDGPNDSLDAYPETKIKPPAAYETGTTRGPTFGQKLHANAVPSQYNQRVPVIGNNIYNNQVNSQTPTQGQTEGNEHISSTTPLPRRPSIFGPPSTPQRGSQYNLDNRNQYLTNSKPSASRNQYYQPGQDSNITRISVLRPTYLPAATDPKDNSRVKGFDRPGLLQPTLGRVPSTTYRPNYSIIDNATPGSTPEVGFNGNTKPKNMGEFAAPSQFGVKQPIIFTSESQNGATRPGFSFNRNTISPTTNSTYQQDFEQSYQQNAPGVTPGVTPGPTYGPYPSTNGVVPTTERSQYQAFQQQQQPTSVPILDDQQENTRVGSYTSRQGYGPTPGSQINDGAMNQQNYQPPVTGQMFGPNQGLQTNVGPTRPNGPYQGSNMGAGEDFSGPKQPQYFDPETGYHY